MIAAMAAGLGGGGDARASWRNRWVVAADGAAAVRLRRARGARAPAPGARGRDRGARPAGSPAARRDVARAGAARAHREIDAGAEGPEPLEHGAPVRGERHPPSASAPLPDLDQADPEPRLRPPEIAPRVAVRPADGADGLREGAEPLDALEEVEPAVADREAAVHLQPELRLDGGPRYVRMSILNSLPVLDRIGRSPGARPLDHARHLVSPPALDSPGA